MANLVLEQPNGKFAIWSTIVDNFILLNATEKEIEGHFVSMTTENSKRSTKLIFERHKEKSKGEIQRDWEGQINFMKEMGHECKELGATNKEKRKCVL